MNKPVAIVLGGTAPHIALIENLKNRGYYTILVDYFENPPAKKAADEHIRESTLDQEKVLDIARQTNAKLVISACVDQANLTACYVAEKLGLPAPYSYETALKVTNKGLMKEIFVKHQIPTAKYCFVNSCEEALNAGLSFPLVVKPADSNGSAGVRKASNELELEQYLDKALAISRTHKAILEEFKTGIEVSIDCYILNDAVDIVLIRQKYSLPDADAMVLQSPGSFSPAFINLQTLDELKKIIQQIGKAFMLDNTPLLVQALIKDSEINILEFAPRVGGGLSYRTVLLNTGFDILEAAINSFMGEKVKPYYIKPKHYLATIIIYARPGVYKKISGVDALIQNNTILEYYPYKTEGMKVGDDMSTKSRIGAFIVKGNSYSEMINKINIAISNLNVFDDNGDHIMYKDIYANITNS